MAVASVSMARTYTEQDLIVALEKVATAIIQDPNGQVYAPIFERLERELADLRSKDTATQRAKKFLEARRAREV